MIIVYYGEIGSGKTLQAVKEALKYLKKGYYIFANFPLRFAYIISYEKFLTYNFPPKSLIIIDEAHIWFNSRNWRETNIIAISKFTQSRKKQYDMILTTQRPESLDTQIRDIANIYCCIEDWGIFVLKKYHSDPIFSHNKKYNLGITIELKKNYSKYFKYYDTYYLVDPYTNFDLMTDVDYYIYVMSNQKINNDSNTLKKPIEYYTELKDYYINLKKQQIKELLTKIKNKLIPSLKKQ